MAATGIRRGIRVLQKTGGLKHLPAAKTDAALLGEIERKSGIRLLKR